MRTLEALRRRPVASGGKHAESKGFSRFAALWARALEVVPVVAVGALSGRRPTRGQNRMTSVWFRITVRKTLPTFRYSL
jgi:hypothetical protein